ncbi:sensor histidine kinase [Priestia taiwanensis]|uniref:Signal transduction histidine-protein kinase/phosphatase DegS n=1 Tax=Priestia taiwanensis TaxID=1347902 RepID=A0A917ESW8_9BACI|nr:sensor histidine kinase [Priestia taiwanensis]MBM7364366.1 two-component system sensor histidine kinase DegS [Priestia taiwanensis]GGE85008.1 signal transduction histidine-protein kinase/phosphatase DegS [Priestia taiwanensis]
MQKVDTQSLDVIINKMISTVEASKDEVFEFGESVRSENERLSSELEVVKIELRTLIEEVDRFEIEAKKARQYLSELSANFQKYSENEVRKAYEIAHMHHLKVMTLRNEEKSLVVRRNELEQRIKNVKEQIERAERISTQVSVVLNYLNSDFKQVGELVENAKQKQEFGMCIIEAQEEEKRRLSREIHDGPAQMLAHLILRANLFERIIKQKGQEAVIDEVKGMKESIRDTLYEVRKIIYDLRPMALDDLGLVPTLRKYFETMSDYHHIEIAFQPIGKWNNTTYPRMAVALFRLAQESVQNVCKHAKATKIDVKLEFMHNQVSLLVRDNGQGFNLLERKEQSFGLTGMRERVDLLNGTIDIRSKVGEGTLISVRVPIE